MYFVFPPHLTIASALPGETGNPEMASFHLNAACFFNKKHAPHKTYEGSIASCCLLHSCSVLTKSVTVSVAVQKMGVVLRQAWSESQWTALMRYLTISANATHRCIVCVTQSN